MKKKMMMNLITTVIVVDVDNLAEAAVDSISIIERKCVDRENHNGGKSLDGREVKIIRM